MPNDFTIPDFLRAIGRGPEERPEWWKTKFADDYVLLSQLTKDKHGKQWARYLADATPHCPFADILDHWTPDKDALLLGAGLEWWRENQTDEIDGAVYKIGFQNNIFWESELLRGPKPGERLARAIWDAVKGGGK